MEILDPYQRPPDNFRNVYKKYQKMKLGDLTRDDEILDLENLSADHKSKVLVTETLDPKILESSFQRFSNSQGTKCANPPVPIYEHKDIAGSDSFSYVCRSQPSQRCGGRRLSTAKQHALRLEPIRKHWSITQMSILSSHANVSFLVLRSFILFYGICLFFLICIRTPHHT